MCIYTTVKRRAATGCSGARKAVLCHIPSDSQRESTAGTRRDLAGTDARCLLRDSTMTEILMSTVSTETNPQASKVSRTLQYTDKRQRAIRKACRSALFTGSAQRSNL